MIESDEPDICDINPLMEHQRACIRVMEAGLWLCRNGWGNMAMLPYMSPSGAHWRCEFHPVGRPTERFYRYSSSSSWKFLQDHCGGRIHNSASARFLAKAIVKGQPDRIAEACHGDLDSDFARWLDQLEAYLKNNLIPVAFADWEFGHSNWPLARWDGDTGISIRPPPNYVKPGTQPHWTALDFWRPSIARLHDLERRRDGFTVRLDDNALVDRVSTELKGILLDADRADAATAFKAAIAKLSV